jgi:hypothetical protein
MELATTIFWLGVGIGALLVGIGVIMIALSLRPVARDARALANDARRLSRLAESELTNLLGRARELTDGAEELSADLAVQLDALKAQTEELEQKMAAEPGVAVAAPVASPKPRLGWSDPMVADDPMRPPEPMAVGDPGPSPGPMAVGGAAHPPDPATVPATVDEAMAAGDAPPGPVGRQPIGSVQSPDAREDE